MEFALLQPIHVPAEDIRRRYDRGVRNLFEVYRHRVHEWVLYDNSEANPVPIAAEVSDLLLVFDRLQFESITKRTEVP
jgi:predicted ABC-type ATPase